MTFRRHSFTSPQVDCASASSKARATAPRWPLAALLLIVLPTLSFGAEAPSVAPDEPGLRLSGEFTFPDAKKPEKTRSSLSGISCPPGLTGLRRCIAVFDEGVEARYLLIDGQVLSPEPDRIVLLAGGKELDAEGAARDDGFVYVTGSHAAKRGDCANNPDDRHVLRFAVDPATGRTRLGENGAPVDLASDNGRLWNLMKQHPILGAFAGDKKCLGSKPPKDDPHLKGQHGVDIEGLAARGGDLYFGFREPAKDRTTFILRVPAAALFSGSALTETLFQIEAGKGRGIRDLLAVQEGMLLLLGPDDDNAEDTTWSVAFWDGTGSPNTMIAPTILANLNLPKADETPCRKEVKPEAIALLEDAPTFRRVLILSDGMCEGDPLAYRIPK